MKKALLLLAICLMVVPALGQQIMLDHGQFRDAVAPTNLDAYLPDGTVMLRQLPDSVRISADLSDAATQITKYGLPYTIDEFYEGAADDADDLSATVRGVNSYDLATLYIMVEVNDEVISTAAGNGWQDDAIELFIDMDNSKQASTADGYPATIFDTNDAQFRLNPTIEEGVVVPTTATQNWSDAGNDPALVGECVKRCEPMTAGWRAIFAVPMTPWGVYPIPNGELGINIQVADNDGADPVAREAVLGWADGDANSWSDPSDWLTAFTYCYTDISYGTPTIDGDPSEWDGYTTHGLYFQNGTAPESEADLSAQWSAMWDLDALYLLTYVTADSVLSNSADNTYERDNVEVFIDFDNSKVVNTIPGDGNSAQLRVMWTDGLDGSPAPAATVAQDDAAGDGWLVEWQLNWNDWGYAVPPSGLIGLDVHVGDNDGTTRDGIIAWYESHSDRAWTDESVFGTARLVPGQTGVNDWTVLDR